MARLWPGDEEMAKKDDDLGAPGHPMLSAQWQATRAPRRRAAVRLVAYAVFFIVFVFALYRLIPSSPTDPADRPAEKGSSSGFNPPRKQQVTPEQDRTYSGPINFPNLGKTLRLLSGTGGGIERNRNVLFATASLQSASTLLPMACQMAAHDANYVHFALASRSPISLKELLELNGIDDSCKLFLHDARPDSPTTSTETRMRLVSARALQHMNNYMHPQAVIIDSTDAEEDYFRRAFRDQIRSTKSALIELPDKPGARLKWITKLDASALSAWNRVDFDILIQAPATGSGNLQRLLNSLGRADMSAVTAPHLTVELPFEVEKPLEKALANFKWPSSAYNELPHLNMVSLRHRIPRSKMTAEESSTRFLESFWPLRPRESHVLVLAPHTEVSPQFFHWDWSDNIMGISFKSPTTHLDATTPFVFPDKDTPAQPASPFLWEAPSSDATLFLGEKWAELHGYVSQLLTAQDSRGDTPAMLAKKDVSKEYPAWLEFALQLSRLRGYLTLYPSQETANVIMGSHSDLGNTPEEYIGDDDLAKDDENDRADQTTLAFDPASQVDMLTTLPQGGDTIALKDLPLLSWEGRLTTLDKLHKAAHQHARQFRREVGQCEVPEEEEEEEGPRTDRTASDLFCTNTKKDT
ncbi:hypothetical protein QQX98_004488 [Neonectria punicea]|uniref:Glycosyltransferase 2 n=1 Tax=Neonectria punicea TaxID=979145 RepID=A0ABR1H8Z3_9HYPO